ncbi:MAG: rhodanese-like domain-containing protein [Coriobacteriia bacterium]|nr:rhodanese-like domain-containing protein [Coriobacteriia bacterium]
MYQKKLHRINRLKTLLVACLALLMSASLLTGCLDSPTDEVPATAESSSTESKADKPDNEDKNSASSTEAKYRKITAAQAKEMMGSGASFTLVDVRTLDEYKEGHIANAMLIPHVEIKNRAFRELPDLNATILTYCRSGVRSAAAAKDLVALGYTNVYDMGGIMDWPYETIKD